MARRRRTQQAKSKRKNGGRYTPPQPRPGSVTFLDGVTVDGQPFGVVAWLCDDPDCPDNHR